MSKQVDSRIVEMQFDNKRFEQGVKTTLNSINTLDATLNKLNTISLKGLDKLGALGSISFDAITNAADMVSSRMSAMGIVGATVLQNLTNAAINAAKHLGQITIGQVMSGGKNRALNIEAAKFQLEGLHVAWEVIEGDLDYAVKGTAYGLDEAAKAASQLVASNVQVGDQMKQSLRAISGVAAMTNRSYEETAQIFTTVAGNGRLMGDQLQQLSSRGLNAAAILAKGLGKTEGEIREMVSKGKIDFKTFAEIMDNEFGEHAKDANKTFTGALSNMKAALSRIGAEFYQPGLLYARDIFNSITGAVNNFKKALAEHKIFQDVSNIMKIVTDHVTGFFNALGDSNGTMEKLVGSGLNKLHSALTAIGNFLQQGLVIRLLDTLKVHLQNVFKIVRAVFAGIKKAFPEDILSSIRRFINSLHDSAKEFDKQATIYSRVRDTVAGIASAFKFVLTVLKTALQLAKPLFDLLGKGIKTVLKYTGDLGNKMTEFVQNTDLYTLWYNGLHKISPRLEELKEKVISAIKSINQKFKDTFGKDIPETIDSIKEKIKGIFTGKNNILESAKEIATNTGNNPFKIMADQLGKTEEEVHKMVESGEITFAEYGQMINNVMGEGTVDIQKHIDLFKVLGAVINVVGKAIEVLISIFGNLYNIIKGNTGIIDSIIGVWDKFISKVKALFGIITNTDISGELSKNISPGFAEFLQDIKDIFANFKVIIQDALKVIQPLWKSFANVLKTVSFNDIVNAITVGGGAVLFKVLLDKIKRFALGFKAAFMPFKNISGAIASFFTSAGTTLSRFSEQISANTLKTIAISIGILAASLFVLSTIDPKKMAAGVGGLTILFSELAGSFALVNKIMLSPGGGAWKISAMLMAMSISVLLLASALKKISKIEPGKLLSSILALTVLFVELGAGLFFLSKYIKDVPKIAATLIALGISLKLITSALYKIGSMNFGDILKGLFGLAVIMGEIFAFTKLMSGNIKNLYGLSTSLILFGIALNILMIPLMELAILGKGGELLEALAGFGVMLLEIAAFSAIMNKIGGKFLLLATSLLIFSVALTFMTIPIKTLGKLAENNTLLQSLGGLALLFAEIAAFSLVMKKIGGKFLLLATSLLIFSAALMAMSIPLKVISGLAEKDTLLETLGGLAVIFAEIAAFSITMKKIGGNFILLATSLVIFAAALNLMMWPLQNLASLAKEDTLLETLGGLLGLLLSIAAFSAIMSKIKGSFAKVSASLIVFAFALNIMVSPLRELAALAKDDTLLETLGGLGLILAELAAFSIIMGKFGKSFMYTAASLIIFGVALNVIVRPLKQLSEIASKNSLTDAIKGLGLLLLEIAGFSILMNAVSVGDIIKISAALVLFAMAISIMAYPLTLLSQIDSSNLVNTLIALGVVLAELAVFSLILGGQVAQFILLSAGLTLMAIALTALCVPIERLSKIPFGEMMKAIGALAIFLGILAAFGALFGFVPELIIGLAAIAASVLVLGAGVALLGVGVMALGAGVNTLATGFERLLTVLKAAGVVIIELAINSALAFVSFISTLANSVPEIEESLLTIISAVCDIIIKSVPKIVETLFILINAVLEKMAEGIPKTIELIAKLIIAVIEALANNIPDFVKSIYDFLHNLIVSLGEYVPKLAEDLYAFVMQIIDAAVGLLERTPFDLIDILFGGGFKKEGGLFSGVKKLFKGSDKEELEETSEEIANTMADSTAESIDTPENEDKVGDSMNGLIEGAAGKLMGNTSIADAMGGLTQGGLDSMTDVLNVQGGESLETQKIAGFAADGFLNEAISGDTLNSFFDAGSLQGDSYQNGLMASLDINSPSKVTEKIAGYADQGFAIGLEQSNASENAANEKASGLMTIFETIGENASKVADGFKTPDFSALFDMNLNPVIAPVLDLSNVSSGFGALDTMFNNNRSIALAGEASYIQDAGRNLSLSIQNDNNKNINGGLSSVGEKLDRLGEAILNRQIVLDSGELVGGLVNPMDRALGVRTIRAQRGGRR